MKVDTTLKRLRNKYILTASLISFFVVILMILLLNILMYAAERSETESAFDMIEQTAITELEKLDTENITLSDMQKNKDGDYIIPRNVQNIDSVTLVGKITCNASNADWYSAGGGLMFQTNENGTIRFAYREYQFNKDISEVTVDFSGFSGLKYETSTDAYLHSGVNNSNFLVSIVWWKNVSNGVPDDVALELESIRIQYKKGTIRNDEIQHSNYVDIYGESMPSLLKFKDSFYLITDSENNLICVNNGTLPNRFSNEKAQEYADAAMKHSSASIALNHNDEYLCHKLSMKDTNVIIFINDDSRTTVTLLIISVISGILIMVILFVIICIISGKVIKPVADTFDKQKEFISDASHELKTPVTVISAANDMLEQKFGSDKWFDQIRTQSEKMGILVNELLELSRLSETEHIRLNFESVDMSEIVKNTLLYFESRAYEEKHTIQSDISDDIRIVGDSLKLERLICILMDNALKHSDDETTIAVALSEEKGRVIITCQNSCSDFNPDDKEYLFERFYRGKKRCSDEKNGYGLGLSIAKAIVELHGGEISISCKDSIVKFVVTINK